MLFHLNKSHIVNSIFIEQHLNLLARLSSSTICMLESKLLLSLAFLGLKSSLYNPLIFPHTQPSDLNNPFHQSHQGSLPSHHTCTKYNGLTKSLTRKNLLLRKPACIVILHFVAIPASRRGVTLNISSFLLAPFQGVWTQVFSKGKV